MVFRFGKFREKKELRGGQFKEEEAAIFLQERVLVESPKIRKERESKVFFGFCFLPFKKRVSRSKKEKVLIFILALLQPESSFLLGLCPLFVPFFFKVVHPMCDY